VRHGLPAEVQALWPDPDSDTQCPIESRSRNHVVSETTLTGTFDVH